MNTIGEFLQRLTTFYSRDHIAPGLQMAYLTDKDQWYVAVHQFPSGVASRKVIAKATEGTLEQAVAKCREVWEGIVLQTEYDRLGVN